jgi:Subtilase family
MMPSSRPIVVGTMLLAFAAAAVGQIRSADPRPLTPAPSKNRVPLSIPAPAAAPTEAPAPAPLMTAPLGAGGTLIGGPLPPPPAAPQPTAETMEEDVAIEPAEVVVVSASMQEALHVQQEAQALGMSVKRRAALGNLGLVISVLRVPKDLSVAAALAQLRQAMPTKWFDANQRYALQAGPAVYGPKLVGWPAAPRGCGGASSIGMIDTAIDLGHPALKSGSVTVHSLLPSGVTPAPVDHGTAVASLLVGDGGFGLMPGAALQAAAVFRLRGEHDADTNAELVARALDWVVGQKVVAVNLSFGGQRNQLVEAAVLRVAQHGVAVLAAAGNGGADAPPVFPAAQAGVIAVTAVDAKLQPYARASRGDYIAFAAPGVDVWAAAPGGAGKYESGTSYAVPFATAIFAAAKNAQPAASWSVLEKKIRSQAKDLGTPGRDGTFGWGLIQAIGGCGHAAR